MPMFTVRVQEIVSYHVEAATAEEAAQLYRGPAEDVESEQVIDTIPWP